MTTGHLSREVFEYIRTSTDTPGGVRSHVRERYGKRVSMATIRNIRNGASYKELAK